MGKSKLEKYVGEILYRSFPHLSIKENYRPQWLLSEDYTRLELDYYIEKLSIAFEVQGEQHFKYIPFFHKNKNKFEKQKQADVDKKNICQNRGIRLYEIFCEKDVDLIVYEIISKSDKGERKHYSSYGERDDEETKSYYKKMRTKKRSNEARDKLSDMGIPHDRKTFICDKHGFNDDQVKEFLFYECLVTRAVNKGSLGEVVFSFKYLPKSIKIGIIDGVKSCKTSYDVKKLFFVDL